MLSTYNAKHKKQMMNRVITVPTVEEMVKEPTDVLIAAVQALKCGINGKNASDYEKEKMRETLAVIETALLVDKSEFKPRMYTPVLSAEEYKHFLENMKEGDLVFMQVFHPLDEEMIEDRFFLSGSEYWRYELGVVYEGRYTPHPLPKEWIFYPHPKARIRNNVSFNPETGRDYTSTTDPNRILRVVPIPPVGYLLIDKYAHFISGNPMYVELST